MEHPKCTYEEEESLSQSTQTVNASATQTSDELHPSSDPPASGSRGRGRGCGRGRGRETAPPIPRRYRCFISPWSGQFFDQWDLLHKHLLHKHLFHKHHKTLRIYLSLQVFCLYFGMTLIGCILV